MKMIELIRNHSWEIIGHYNSDNIRHHLLRCNKCELFMTIRRYPNIKYWSFPHDEFAGQPLLLTEFFPEENANQLYSCQYRIMCMALTENSP